jgi:SAM-dependent methyltransferase
MKDTDAFEKMERDGWSDPSIAKGYADSFSLATGMVARHLADAVQAGPGVQVLDLCSGHGVVAVELLRRGATVTGLDFSPAMVALARQAAPEATFLQGDALNLTFPDNSFDAVTIGFGVPHFPQPERGLEEAFRILRPGGRLAFSIWFGKGSNGAFDWLFEAVERLGDPSVTLPQGPDAHLLANGDIARSMLAEANFVDVRTSEISSQLLVPVPEALFDTFDRGAVRAASLLGHQTQERRNAIRTALADRVRSEGVKVDRGFLVPAPSVIHSAICC